MNLQLLIPKKNASGTHYRRNIFKSAVYLSALSECDVVRESIISRASEELANCPAESLYIKAQRLAEKICSSWMGTRKGVGITETHRVAYHTPDEDLIREQKAQADLVGKLKQHGAVHGFARNRSTYTAALEHSFGPEEPRRSFFKMDMRDFFSSVSGNMISKSLHAHSKTGEGKTILTERDIAAIISTNTIALGESGSEGIMRCAAIAALNWSKFGVIPRVAATSSEEVVMVGSYVPKSGMITDYGLPVVTEDSRVDQGGSSFSFSMKIGYHEPVQSRIPDGQEEIESEILSQIAKKCVLTPFSSVEVGQYVDLLKSSLSSITISLKVPGSGSPDPLWVSAMPSKTWMSRISRMCAPLLKQFALIDLVRSRTKSPVEFATGIDSMDGNGRGKLVLAMVISIFLCRNLCFFGSGITPFSRVLLQGRPAAPALSNLAFKLCDIHISSFASRRNLRYTRYADDITISWPDRITMKRIRMCQWSVATMCSSFGFQIHPSKTMIMGPGMRQRVLGYIMNSGTPRIPRERRKRVAETCSLFHTAIELVSSGKEEFKAVCQWLVGSMGESCNDRSVFHRVSEILARLKGEISYMMTAEPHFRERHWKTLVDFGEMVSSHQEADSGFAGSISSSIDVHMYDGLDESVADSDEEIHF